jgi:MOSC domain-containing protein YiiM
MSAAVGRIVQLSISPGGVPKRAIPAATIGSLGLEGDEHDYRHHGGPERAVCLFPLELIRTLAAEGHAIVPGAIGENVTTEGLDWSLVVPGARLQLGDRVLLHVTRYTSPCTKIAPVFTDRDYGRVSQKLHPGESRVYTSVLVEGVVRTGDVVRVVDAGKAAPLGAPGR